MHIAYCWELGRGYGHVARINQIANDESLSSCQFSFILRELNKSHVIDKTHRGNLYQAPHVNLPIQGFSPNFSHLLLRCGWQEPQSAIAIISAWINLFESIKPDVVFLDHAPSAGVAAILLGIPHRQLGNGFETPPCADPMPSLQLHLQPDIAKLKQVDQDLNLVLDKVEHEFTGRNQQMIRLQSLFRPEQCLIVGSPLLDHYGNRDSQWRYREILTQANVPEQDLSVLSDNTKPNLFFYLEAGTPGLAELLSLLCTKFTVFGYVTNVSDVTQLDRLEKTGAVIFRGLLNVDQALTVSEAVVCNAGVGLVAQAINVAKPLLVLPMQLEQNMVAFQLHKLRIAWAVGGAKPAQQVAPHLDSWIRQHNDIATNIKQRCSAPEYQKKLWHKNLKQDFVLA